MRRRPSTPWPRAWSSPSSRSCTGFPPRTRSWRRSSPGVRGTWPPRSKRRCSARAKGGRGSRRSSGQCSASRHASPSSSGLLREVGRLGPPAATQMTLALEPLVQRASSFLEAEMDAGAMRRHDPRLLLLAIYSTVIGMVTEVEVLRALGEEPTARSLVRRRADVLQLLRSALLLEPAGLDSRSAASDRGATPEPTCRWPLFSRFGDLLPGWRFGRIALVGARRFAFGRRRRGLGSRLSLPVCGPGRVAGWLPRVR